MNSLDCVMRIDASAFVKNTEEAQRIVLKNFRKFDEAYKVFPWLKHMCRCGCGLIVVSHRMVMAHYKLTQLVDPQLIEYTSGTRCLFWNKHEGGSSISLHLGGKAMDLRIKGYTLAEMYEVVQMIEAFRNGGIGLYIDWGHGPGIHVDVRYGHARWGRDGSYTGGQKGIEMALRKVA